MEYKIFSRHPQKGYIVVEPSGETTQCKDVIEAVQYIEKKKNDK